MNRYLKSIGYVKATMETGGNIWDSLVTIISNIVISEKVSDINTETLCQAFEHFFGKRIPLHPMNTIVGKMLSSGILYRVGNTLQIDPTKVPILDHTASLQKLTEVVSSFIQYSKDVFDLDLEYQDAETKFLEAIAFFDLDILYSFNGEAIRPEEQLDAKDLFAVFSYFKYVNEKDPENFRYIQDIVLSSIHINTIFFRDDESKVTFSKQYVYLDTRIILRAVGLEGEFRKNEYQSLLAVLRDNKCNLRMFSVHHGEVVAIIDDCLRRVENKSTYNPKYASRSLKYFIDNKLSVADVLICREEIDALFTNFKIGIDDHNYNQEDVEYNIDQKKLYELVKAGYRTTGYAYEDDEDDKGVWRDVNAINTVYQKRKGKFPNSLRFVTHIFITTNKALVRAVKNYNTEVVGQFYKFMECVTDTYYGTSIWMNTSDGSMKMFTAKFMADILSVTTLNPRLKERFLANLEELKSSDKIDEKTYFALKEYDRSYEIIQNSTLNDESEYSDSLPEEIIEEIKRQAQEPILRRVEEKDSAIEKGAATIQILEEKNALNRLRIEKSSIRDAKTIFVLAQLGLSIPALILVFGDIIPSVWLKIVIGVIAVGLDVLISVEVIRTGDLFAKLRDQFRTSRLKKWNLD